jgi:hypothetical protein
MDIIQARLVRSIGDFTKALVVGVVPATQAAGAAFQRLGVAFAGLAPFVRQAAESTAGCRYQEAPSEWRKTGYGWVRFRRER